MDQMDKKVAQVSCHWSDQYFQENILVEFCLDVVMELLYSFINMGQLHVFFLLNKNLTWEDCLLIFVFLPEFD